MDGAGNYDSGDDYVVEFLGYRFSFNADDFEQRVTAAAVKLGLLGGNELDDDETADLVELVERDAIEEPRSTLGRYLVRHWEDISLVEGESLVYWLKKLVFRGAWLDHRVKAGQARGRLRRGHRRVLVPRPARRARAARAAADAELARGAVPPMIRRAAVVRRRRARVPRARSSRSTRRSARTASSCSARSRGSCCSPRSDRCRRSRARRRSASSCFATVGEVTGSLVWGVYRYRLHNLPLFIPPAHGLVYLSGLALAALVPARRIVVAAAAVGAVAWGIAGLTVLPRLDVAGAIGVPLLCVFLWRSRFRAAYAGVFLVVAALELYGTSIGTWRWATRASRARHPRRQPAERRRERATSGST